MIFSTVVLIICAVTITAGVALIIEGEYNYRQWVQDIKKGRRS